MSDKKETFVDENQDFVITYKTYDNETSFNAIIKDNTIWLSIDEISTLFHISKLETSRLLFHIFKDKVFEIEHCSEEFMLYVPAMSDYSPTKYFSLALITYMGNYLNSPYLSEFKLFAKYSVEDYFISTIKLDHIISLEQSRLLVLFKNSVVKQIELQDLINFNPTFSDLENEELFKQAKIEENESYIFWNERLKISHIDLWEQGTEVQTM